MQVRTKTKNVQAELSDHHHHYLTSNIGVLIKDNLYCLVESTMLINEFRTESGPPQTTNTNNFTVLYILMNDVRQVNWTTEQDSTEFAHTIMHTEKLSIVVLSRLCSLKLASHVIIIHRTVQSCKDNRRQKKTSVKSSLFDTV